MSKSNVPNTHEIEIRARWLAWLYRLEPAKVSGILSRSKANVRHTVMSDFFTYYDWLPSLEKALKYGMPSTIIQIFETADPKAIDEWIQQTERLLDGAQIDFPEVEELCRWEAEQTLLPD